MKLLGFLGALLFTASFAQAQDFNDVTAAQEPTLQSKDMAAQEAFAPGHGGPGGGGGFHGGGQPGGGFHGGGQPGGGFHGGGQPGGGFHGGVGGGGPIGGGFHGPIGGGGFNGGFHGGPVIIPRGGYYPVPSYPIPIPVPYPVQGGGYYPNYPVSQQLELQSFNGENEYVNTNYLITSAYVIAQLSNVECVEGLNWGTNGSQLWVNGGCAAEFQIQH